MTKLLLEGTLTCSSSSKKEQITKAIARVVYWIENSLSVVVYLDEEGNYWIPTPYDELEELDFQFGSIEIDEEQPEHIK